MDKEYWGFPVLFKGSVVKSLIHFLSGNDRRKIKICVQCKKFFIQNRLDPRRKHCSVKCKNAYNKYSPEKRKAYQRSVRKREQEKKEKKIKGTFGNNI